MQFILNTIPSACGEKQAWRQDELLGNHCNIVQVRNYRAQVRTAAARMLRRDLSEQYLEYRLVSCDIWRKRSLTQLSAWEVRE